MSYLVQEPENQLPDHIRAKFYDILTHVYIDTEPIQKAFSSGLRHKSLKVWSRLGEDTTKRRTDELQESIHSSFIDLKVFMQQGAPSLVPPFNLLRPSRNKGKG